MTNTIDINKKYKTRDGRDVIIYAVYDKGSYPIHGAIKLSEGWMGSMWTKEGVYCEETQDPFDLVEVEEEVEYDFWVNVYEDGRAIQHTTKADANLWTDDDDRIACINIKGTVKKGEGL